LTPDQVTRAEIQRRAPESTMVARIPETGQWLLVPVQSTPQSPLTREASRLSVPDARRQDAALRRAVPDQPRRNAFEDRQYAMETDRQRKKRD
jgi:hypothetical protein